LTVGRPRLDWDEIAMALEIELPNALFKKPRLEAKIVVPDEAAVTDTIESVVTENVKEALEQATGLIFSVSVVTPESD